MKKTNNNNLTKSGFTLIEIVVTLGIAVLGLLAITQLFKLYLQIISDEKFRVTAVVLANKKIETIRNLKYSQIGTMGGIPPGNLPQNEIVTKNGINFNVKTEIVYIDDPFDGSITGSGSDSSIYSDNNQEITFYWSMESAASGQSPDIGQGTISTENVSLVNGYDNNGLQFDQISQYNGSKVIADPNGNINITKGRIGFWVKPENDEVANQYFFRVKKNAYYFSISSESDNNIRFSYGQNGDVQSEPLNWNAGQWYFIEAAWDNTAEGYREIWRDGIPLARGSGVVTPPTFSDELYIGYRGDSYFFQGIIDEIYILNEPHKFEVWGYNQTNPYNESNLTSSFYWNMDDTAPVQTPQKGTGSVLLGGNYAAKTPAVKNNGLELSGFYHDDYAQFPTSGNIDFTNGRIGFWYNPRGNSVYSYNTPNLINSDCTNGLFQINRLSSGQLSFGYGSTSENTTILSQDRVWDKDWWYFIEVAFNSADDFMSILIDGQEVANETTISLSQPSGCSNIFIGNENNNSVYNGEGNFDEIYVLTTAYPVSGEKDTLNTDYKRVKITVSWQTTFGDKKIYILTDIAPPGVETIQGGGTLIFHIFDSNGLPVPNAEIEVINNKLDPAINLQLTTNDNGNLILPGAPATTTSYQITVSKPGYSSDYTMTATSTYINPVRDHLSVLDGETTEVSFSIDQTSEILVKTVSQSYPINWQINTNEDETNQFNPSLANNDTYAFFAWEDFRTSSTSLVYANRYTTSGTSPWSNDSLINETQNQFSPKIALDSTANQYITWSDDSAGNKDIYIAKLNSSGINSWGTAYKVNSDMTANDQINPSIYFSNNEAYLVWEDARADTGDIYFNKFTSAGSKAYANDIKINSDSGTAHQKEPIIVSGSDNNLYIAWLDNRSGSYELYLHKIDNNGNGVWANEIKINTALATNIINFDLALDSSDNSYLTWSDNRNGNYDIFWQSIASTSALYFANDQAITTQSPSHNQQQPKIAVDGNDDLFIGWQDNRAGSQDVYVLKIDNQGNLLWPQEVKMNIETENDQIINDLSIYATDRVIAVWTDYSQTNTNVWAGTLNYNGSETAIPYVDFQLTGAKLTHQSPDLPKFDQEYTTNAQGELLISDLEWDTYTITLTDSAYSLIQSQPASPFSLQAATSTNLKLIVN